MKKYVNLFIFGIIAIFSIFVFIGCGTTYFNFDISINNEEGYIIFNEIDKTITITSNEILKIKKDKKVTVKAMANSGYEFECWQSDDGEFISYNDEYTFTIASNISLVAKYKLKKMIINYEANNTIKEFILPASNTEINSSISNINIVNPKDNMMLRVFVNVSLIDKNNRIHSLDGFDGKPLYKINMHSIEGAQWVKDAESDTFSQYTSCWQYLLLENGEYYQLENNMQIIICDSITIYYDNFNFDYSDFKFIVTTSIEII